MNAIQAICFNAFGLLLQAITETSLGMENDLQKKAKKTQGGGVSWRMQPW